jgi:hypothetical protein
MPAVGNPDSFSVKSTGNLFGSRTFSATAQHRPKQSTAQSYILVSFASNPRTYDWDIRLRSQGNWRSCLIKCFSVPRYLLNKTVGKLVKDCSCVFPSEAQTSRLSFYLFQRIFENTKVAVYDQRYKVLIPLNLVQNLRLVIDRSYALDFEFPCPTTDPNWCVCDASVLTQYLSQAGVSVWRCDCRKELAKVSVDETFQCKFRKPTTTFP